MTQKTWLVLEFERVDVRTMGHPGPKFAPGDVAKAHRIYASTEDAAIEYVAEVPGFYSAMPWPDLPLRQVVTSIEASGP